jgi:hypothetical protein
MQVERKTTNLKTGVVTVEMIDAPVDTTKPDLIADLAARRARMSCTPMQGILTLGEAEWGKVLTYRETATWAERVVIDSAQTWNRNSQNIQFIGYLIGYNDEQMDAMFATAAMVET